MATKARQKAQAKYNSKPAQKKRRAMRNKARRKLIRTGRVRKDDGKDVAHKDNNPFNSSNKNLSVQSPSKNRSFARTKTGKRKR